MHSERLVVGITVQVLEDWLDEKFKNLGAEDVEDRERRIDDIYGVDIPVTGDFLDKCSRIVRVQRVFRHCQLNSTVNLPQG